MVGINPVPDAGQYGQGQAGLFGRHHPRLRVKRLQPQEEVVVKGDSLLLLTAITIQRISDIVTTSGQFIRCK